MNWKIVDKKLIKVFILHDLSEIIQKLNILTEIANEKNHHPNFCVFDYRKIRFELWTHDQNTITAADYKLAEIIDSLFGKVRPS